MNQQEHIYKVYYYHPQTKFAKVMFLHLSVSDSVHMGGVPRQVPPAGTPPGQVPTESVAPWVGILSRYTPRSGTPPRQVEAGT